MMYLSERVKFIYDADCPTRTDRRAQVIETQLDLHLNNHKRGWTLVSVQETIRHNTAVGGKVIGTVAWYLIVWRKD